MPKLTLEVSAPTRYFSDGQSATVDLTGATIIDENGRQFVIQGAYDPATVENGDFELCLEATAHLPRGDRKSYLPLKCRTVVTQP